MKVLITNKFLYPNGGSETYAFGLGKGLEEAGCEVQYFGMEHSDRIVGNRINSYTASMDFHTGRLSKLVYPFRIIYSLEARKKLRLVLEDFEPDIVQINNFNFQLTPSIIYEIESFGKKKGRKIPIIYTAHDYQWVCPNHMLFQTDCNRICFDCQGGRYGKCIQGKCIHGSLAKSILGAFEGLLYHKLKTYQKVDLVICPSTFMKTILMTDPILKEKLLVMHNFLEIMHGEVTEKKNYVLYFGRYAKEKGIETLLEVCKKLPDIPFVFAGTGPMKTELSRIPNITDKGFQKGKELQKLISEAKFTVFPSEWYENCPYSVMESQIYGTPVIATDIGGVPELLENGVTGELFHTGNQEELKERIENLWKDTKKNDRYIANCKESHFISREEYVADFIRLCEEFLKNEKR